MDLQRNIELSFSHRVSFTRGAFEPENHVLADLLGGGERVAKVLVYVDGGVVAASPGFVERVEAYFRRFDGQLELVAPPVVLGGGEPVKNDWRQVERIWGDINACGLDRHSYVLAIGGGAVLDLVGFAAATAHRGVRQVRMPTTTLSQGDGGVGVKNGVNFFAKKNWVGTFCVPFAVVNDYAFVELLPEREKRAGIIEAIKVAAIRDGAFFEWMEANAGALGELDDTVLEEVVRRSAALHVEHIATSGDPFEFGSARPLDFGHWVAHKLEQVSGFAVGHGEAVAVGIAVDLLYSELIGLTAAPTARRILALIENVGFSIYSDWLETEEDGQPVILRGLEEFREHLGGQLTITLVPELGRKIEVHEMDEEKVMSALELLRDRVTAGREV